MDYPTEKKQKLVDALNAVSGPDETWVVTHKSEDFIFVYRGRDSDKCVPVRLAIAVDFLKLYSDAVSSVARLADAKLRHGSRLVDDAMEVVFEWATEGAED